jgi:eukaryotic-like serine/threonine-protein kinase
VLQGRYRIVARIGEGAMGTVYRAERLELGRVVAIKFLHGRLANEPLLVRHFDVEARAMSRLGHPNCVSIVDFGVDDLPYLVMDFIQGRSLRALIDEGPVPAPRALRIVRQILAALGHSHDHGIIHRDIKPENVIIENLTGLEDHVRVLDFGLARFMHGQRKPTSGMTLGTPSYMAPELAGDGTIDERVDLYACGVVLFEMLTSRPPFQAADVGEMFLQLLTVPPPLLRQQAPHAGFSPELEQVVQRSLAKQPEERFPSAAAMVAALEAVPDAAGAQGQVPPAAAPATADAAPVLGRWVAGRRARSIAAAVTSVVALAAMLAISMKMLRTRPETVALGSPTGAASAGAGSAAAASGIAGNGSGTPADELSRAQAIQRLVALRRAEPANAAHPAALAQLYFEKRWWGPGLEAARAAGRLDPSYRSDPALLRHVVAALQSDKAGDQAADYLRALGAIARPSLQEAARSHPHPRVRARAAEILKPRVPQFSFGGFGRR